MPSQQLNFSVDVQTKEEAERILKRIGLTVPEALRMFLRQVVEVQGLPLNTVARHSRSDRMLSLTPEEYDAVKETFDHPERQAQLRERMRDYHKIFPNVSIED